ncbi:phosphatase 2C-like domain-containing protein [Infundibulicybe gibba]|nr:phosphatase 2C-like domain-containing protein [Infundibulicybe gibba]
MDSMTLLATTNKISATGGNDQFVYAVSEMQGWRISMEDAHAAVLNLEGDKEPGNTFFAVYDGHGGGAVAKFAGQNVHKRLVTEETYHEKNYEGALKRAFLGTDEDLLANPSHTQDPSGCTAVAALITSDGKIYVANAGDSRSVLSIKGEVKPLSFDHKPSSDTEKARIHGAGGYIEYGRVNGNLALSRALGDFQFKKNYSVTPEKQIITADPDVTCHEITEDDEFLILACDGIWDCLSSQQVVDIVRYQVAQGKELSEIGEMICDHCLAPDTSSGTGIGCDNMTILIVAILHGRTKEEWYAWIADRVKNGYGYQTPSEIPALYALSRILSFRARKEALDARRNGEQPTTNGGLFGRTGPDLSRFLGASDSGSLMFGSDDSDDSDSDEEMGPIQSSNAPGLGFSLSPAALTLLGIRGEEDSHQGEDEDTLHLHSTQGETPPPKAAPNGDTPSISPVPQLTTTPGGDEIPPVVKAEGFLDSSEDPLKA